MTSRRAFLGLVSGATAAAAFRDDAVERVLAASRGAEGAPPETIAADESYWKEVQQALLGFGDLDGAAAHVLEEFTNGRQVHFLLPMAESTYNVSFDRLLMPRDI